MINNNWPPSPADPPIEVGPPIARVDNRVAWRPLLLRMFVVVPPAQVLGIVAGAQLMAGTGLLERTHWLSAVISVISGVLSGLAGWLLPDPDSSAAADLRASCGRLWLDDISGARRAIGGAAGGLGRGALLVPVRTRRRPCRRRADNSRLDAVDQQKRPRRERTQEVMRRG